MSKKTKVILTLVIVGGVIIALLLGCGTIAALRTITSLGITRGPDQMFGDQNLKTAVALIELHKVRYGKYPAKLSELKFIGDWDTIALSSVLYYPNKDLTAYYIEVERGWVGRPELNMPDEFWQGTGYRKDLKP